MTVRTKTYSIMIKEAESVDDGMSMLAYAATFDREPDSYGDIIAPGAFKRTLKEWDKRDDFVPLLYGHRTDDPFLNIGRIEEAREDEHGLLVETSFDKDNPRAIYSHKLAKEGRLSKLSFSFSVLDAGPVELEDGRVVNEIRDVDLYEVSLVPIPANQNTGIVEIRSAENATVAEGTSQAKEAQSEEQDEVHELLKQINEVLHIKKG